MTKLMESETLGDKTISLYSYFDKVRWKGMYKIELNGKTVIKYDGEHYGVYRIYDAAKIILGLTKDIYMD
jgi:hypothetical protein